MKLRLLLLEECNRSCKGCCNKEWDLGVLPECRSFAGYSEVILTGGEPLLVPGTIRKVVQKVRAENPTAKIFIYTAWRESVERLIDVLRIVDGITLTLHTRKDTEPLQRFANVVALYGLAKEKSLRLNVFRGISTGTADLTGWQVKRDMVWIKDCPLPADEVFMRLPTNF